MVSWSDKVTHFSSPHMVGKYTIFKHKHVMDEHNNVHKIKFYTQHFLGKFVLLAYITHFLVIKCSDKYYVPN